MIRILVVAVIAALASSAWAQKSKSGNSGFDAMDKNRDGFLGKEEIAGDKELAKRLETVDGGDGDKRWFERIKGAFSSG